MTFDDLQFTKVPIIVSYGGGVNSTALLVELVRRELRVDLILFANTGGEKPETYEYVSIFSAWLEERGYPGVTVVQAKYKKEPITLEEKCKKGETIPSLAFGMKRCSIDFKKVPCERYVSKWWPAKVAWKRGVVAKYIGIDAEESHRAKGFSQDAKYDYFYPLIEWDWGREDCVEAIEDAGLPSPPKSSCFFCPAMKKKEIIDLRDNNPELLQRALEMEERAMPSLHSIKGLGRYFSWKEFLENPGKYEQRSIEIDCECFDG